MVIYNTILEAIIAVGVIAFAIGQFVNGRTEKKDAGLVAATNTIEILQKNVDILTQSQKEDHDQITRLQEQIKLSTAENDRLTKIIENRNPDLEKVLSEIRDFMAKLNAKNDHQTNILEGQLAREGIIDRRDKNLKSGRIN